MVVVDGGVVVHQLLAARQVEPVHQGLNVGRVEPDVEVVASDRAAHGESERPVVAIAILLHVGQPHMESGLALALDPGVLGPGTGARHHLGHRICEVGRARRQGHVALDHRGPRLAVHQEEVPGMGYRVRRLCSADEKHVDRGVELHAGRHMDKRAFPEECGIERGEGALLHRRVTGQIDSERRIVAECLVKRARVHAGGELRQVREARVIPAIHKHQPGPLGVAEDERLEFGCRDCGDRRRRELAAGDGRDRSEAPLLVLRSRESDFGKTAKRLLPDWRKPLGTRTTVGGERLELVHVRFCRHAPAPAVACSATHS